MTRRDPNIALGGQAYALNVLTPISPGREAELGEVLAAAATGTGSPFASLPSTHFARLVIVDRLAFDGPRRRAPALRLQYLLLSSVFDGPLEDWVRALCVEIPEWAEAIWGCCLGAPQPVTADDRAFVAWIRHNQVDTGAFFAPYGDATVDRIRESLARVRRLRELAESTQYLSAVQLKRRWDDELRSRGVVA